MWDLQQSSLSNQFLYETVNEETTSKLWLKLKKKFMKKFLCSKFFLVKCLFELHLKDYSSLKEHFNEMNSILLELKDINVKMKNKKLVVILIVSLPPSFETFIYSNVGKDYNSSQG